MPEPLELLLRGFERRRMAVAEADDGDAGDAVEVAPAVVGDQPAAVAVDERDGEARVRREQRGAGQRRSCAAPRSRERLDLGAADERARRRARAAVIAAPSLGRIRGSSVPPASRPSAVGDVERVDDLAVEHEALDVGEEEQLVGAARRPRSRPRRRRR